MELLGDRLIPAPLDVTWAALNDVDTLKACIPGCESLESTGPDAYTVVVALKVGPVSARFKGNLVISNLAPPTSYTINFEGQGGMAGHGKGSADVVLAAETPTETRLKYTARAQVGGKIAQVGSRLIDAAAGKIADTFFKNFEKHLQADIDRAADGDAPAA